MSAPAGMPEPQSCTACGQIPDTSRVTCIPCLTGRSVLTTGNPTALVFTTA